MTTKSEFQEFLSGLPLFDEDSYGNFKSDDGEWRYKLGPKSVRFEHKIWSEATEYTKRSSMWIKRWSAYYTNIEFVDTGEETRFKILKEN